MAVSLFLTTLFSIVVFIPLALVMHQKKATENSSLRKPAIFIFGGATWSIVAVVQYIVLQVINLIRPFEIAIESSISSFNQVQTEARTILFWYLFFIAVIAQIILYRGSITFFTSDSPLEYAFFGFGWGISELIQRFVFFDSGDFNLQLFLALYSILLGSMIGTTIIRIRENTKFIMFAAILKFFSEIGLFGSIGYQGLGYSLFDLYSVLILAFLMAALSMITRKFPLKED